ncbi:MAG: hypothetical protein ACJAVV_000213 [Alphaproteobacteria bacterium]|jgi:hypothetical protein
MSNSYTAIVSQAIDLLDGIGLREYQQKLPPHFPSSIGSHIRHIVDHFLALIDGHGEGHIDYNIRHRHNQIEQFPCAAVEALEGIVHWLNNLQEDCLDNLLTVASEVDVSRTHSTTCRSTLERELVFASSHAIHHYALIRIICSMQNKEVPALFGYAPATITHINKTA